MINVAVIGGGRIGRLHLKNLSRIPNVKVVGVAEIKPTEDLYNLVAELAPPLSRTPSPFRPLSPTTSNGVCNGTPSTATSLSSAVPICIATTTPPLPSPSAPSPTPSVSVTPPTPTTPHPTANGNGPVNGSRPTLSPTPSPPLAVLPFPIVEDYHTLLNDPTIEAVLVCTNTALHPQICLDALKAGKHVFCEKPVSYDLDVLRKLQEEVDRTGLILQVGFNRRFDNHFRRGREILSSGKVGRPHTIRITSRDPTFNLEYLREAAKAGGIYFDFVIHDFDMLHYLISGFQESTTVSDVVAMGSTLLAPELTELGDVDTSVVTLKLNNGCLVIIDNSRQAVYGYDQRIEIFGADGCIMINNEQCSSAVVLSRDPPSSDKLKWFFADRYADAFLNEMEEFINCVRNQGKPSVGLKDAYNAVHLATLAKQSLTEHRIVSNITGH
ncbi:inositol 2-dehydrogenase [Pelomyxa schiedti]|nr:inositol 2-dehydrogenase [Pelomyxa schiedti]